MAKARLTVDGIPVVNLSESASEQPPLTDAQTKPLETAQDATGPAPSRWWLRATANVWRGLQYIGMTSHFLAPERPPSPSFVKTIPSTISKVKGDFTLQFYTPKGYSAKTSETFPAVVNFHGGGFVIGNATDDARFARFVLEQCNAVFISVDYRLSPENPFPVAVQDAADALLYLIHFGPGLHIDPLRLAVSGFSAGGNLALTSTLCLADHVRSLKGAGTLVPEHRIRAVASWYPVTDYTRSRAAKRASCVRPDQTIPETLTNLFDASYLHPPTLELANPYLSPVKATNKQLVDGMPEMVIVYTCEWDMLMKEGGEFAKRLGEAPIGKDVRYKMVEGVPHAWDKSPSPTRVAERSEELYAECCGYLREAFEKD